MLIEILGIGCFGAGVLAGYILWGVETLVSDSDDDEEETD